MVSASLGMALCTRVPHGISNHFTAISKARQATRLLAMVSLGGQVTEAALPCLLTNPLPARNLLCNMTHRGAVGSDARDGDGAGVMTSIPHRFFVKNFEREENIKLPPSGQYAVGNLFFKPDEETLQESIRQFEEIAEILGLRILGWRRPPVDSTLLGPAAKSREPVIMQPFVVLASAYGQGDAPENTDPEKFDERFFEIQLFVLRKRATHTIGLHNWFYLCSLSSKNIVYKGQLAPVQVYEFFHDLVNADYEAHFALVHSRFSTNTFPSWDRAQPLRWAAHNGECLVSTAIGVYVLTISRRG